jgi:hypothetical protein
MRAVPAPQGCRNPGSVAGEGSCPVDLDDESQDHDPPEAGRTWEVPLAGITSRRLTESRSRPTALGHILVGALSPRGQCGATALKADSEPLFKDSEKCP